MGVSALLQRYLTEGAEYEFDALKHWAYRNLVQLQETLRAAAHRAAELGKPKIRTADEFEKLLRYSGLPQPPGGYERLVEYLFETPEEDLIGDDVPEMLRAALDEGYSAGLKGEEHA